MKTIAHYRKVLKSMDISIDEASDQLVMDMVGETPLPLTMDGGKSLVLPTDRYLDNLTKYPDTVYFHPLSESTTAKVSKVQARMIKIIEVQINTIVAQLLQSMLMLMHDSKLSSKGSRVLGAALAEVESNNGAMSEKTYEYLVKQLSNFDPAQRDSFLRMKLVNKPTIEGKTYLRGVRFHSPLLERLRDEESTSFITSKYPNTKARGIMLDLVELVIGRTRSKISKHDDQTDYSVGVHSHVAPNYTSVLLAYSGVMADLEYLTGVMRKLLTATEMDYCLVKRDFTWDAEIDKIKDFISEIPPLEHNYSTKGSDLVMTDDNYKTDTVPASTVAATAEVEDPEPARREVRRVIEDTTTPKDAYNPATPVAPTVQAPTPSSDTLTMSEFRRLKQQQAQAAQPQQGGWGQPQQPQQGYATGWGQSQQPQQIGWGQSQQPMLNNGWGPVPGHQSAPPPHSVHDIASSKVSLIDICGSSNMQVSPVSGGWSQPNTGLFR